MDADTDTSRILKAVDCVARKSYLESHLRLDTIHNTYVLCIVYSMHDAPRHYYARICRVPTYLLYVCTLPAVNKIDAKIIRWKDEGKDSYNT